MECCGKMLYTVCWKKITYHILCDNLCWKIASENRILVLLVVCGVARHASNLNQTTSLTILYISELFCKTKANSLSQRRTQVTTMIQYDISRIWTVTYLENLPINFLFKDLIGDFIPMLLIQAANVYHCKFYISHNVKIQRRELFLQANS